MKNHMRDRKRHGTGYKLNDISGLKLPNTTLTVFNFYLIFEADVFLPLDNTDAKF